MYRIYADSTLIYDSRLEDYVISRGEITKEVNKSGSFEFTIYQNNPYFDKIQKLKTIITVYKRNKLIFRGRVISDETGFYNDKTFICEGELSFLLDSIQRPYDFTGSPGDLLAQFLESHNSQVGADKQFQLGEVTISDANDYIARSNIEYEDTFSNIDERLLKTHGGYLHITRDANGVPFLNWFEDFPYKSYQRIEFGENLLDFMRTNSAETIATAIIPLGATIEDTEQKLTIASVNNGVDYVYDQTAVNTYGWIFKVVEFDDVTDPANLITKARAYLSESINQNTTIELTAVDLSLLDKSIDSFDLGDYIEIESKPHGVREELLLQKQTINLLKPDSDTITLGYSYSTFTDRTLASANNNATLTKKVAVIESNYTTGAVVTESVEYLRSLIDQTSTSISTEVSADFVESDELTRSIGTLYTQLNDSFTFNFSQLETVVNENDVETRRILREISQYIRFENGNIILGDSESELILRVENDRIAFLESGEEVAYFSNHKLYITNAEVLHSLKIGNFAYTPRDNGNLSFGKIGG